eukprot:363736-Chlamydomonas_euryale.AAC.6
MKRPARARSMLANLSAEAYTVALRAIRQPDPEADAGKCAAELPARLTSHLPHTSPIRRTLGKRGCHCETSGGMSRAATHVRCVPPRRRSPSLAPRRSTARPPGFPR